MASKLVIALVFVFDLIAFALAVAAEQRRSKATFQKDSEDEYTYCVYDSDIATGFGVGALLFLLLSQVILMAVSRCFCCGRGIGPSGSRACSLILFLLSWLTFLIAEACLLAGSVRNAHHTRYRTMFFDGNPSCETLRKGVFAAGAAFVFFTAILSEFYYITFSKATRDGGAPPYGGPAVGMSTYKRRGTDAELGILGLVLASCLLCRFGRLCARSFSEKALSNEGGGKASGGSTHLYLNVYDLTPANNYLYWFGIGVFHSGIEVHGMEYSFGAHDYPTSGVFEVEPKSCPGFIFRRSVWLGITTMYRAEFRILIEDLVGRYHGDAYHLIIKNCNHFTDEVCLHLTGKPIPGWVNRLA